MERISVIVGLLVLIGCASLYAEEGVRADWHHSAQLEKLGTTTDDSFTFAVMGDGEPGQIPWRYLFPPFHGRRAFRAQMERVDETNARFVIQLGDFVRRGTQERYQRFFTTLTEAIRKPVFLVLGNHDRLLKYQGPVCISDKSVYCRYVGQPDFYFDYGAYRFVLMDSANERLRPDQLAWLERVLSSERPTVIAMHIPPAYLVHHLRGPAHTIKEESRIVVRHPIFGAFFKEGAQELGNIVTRHNVVRMYFGHIHTLSHADIRGVVHVISGGGGSPLYRVGPIPTGKSALHFLLVHADQNGIDEEIVMKNGTTMRFGESIPSHKPLS